MSDQSKSTAKLMFDRKVDIDFANLINELQRVFRNIALEFDQAAVAEGNHAMFVSEGLILRIANDTDGGWETSYAGKPRPSHQKASGALIDAFLGDVKSALTVTVSPGPARELPERVQLAALYHVVRHILRRHDASLVHWSLSDTLFTADEFESPVSPEAAPQPRRPQRTRETRAQKAMRREARKAKFHDQELDVARTHARLDEDYVQAQAEKKAAARARIEDPVRAEEHLRRARHQIFAEDFIETVDHQVAPPQEVGLIEQITVYVMTITIMVLSFPIGFAMLVYTVLRGESLKITARAMALSGVGVGLAANPATMQILSLLA